MTKKTNPMTTLNSSKTQRATRWDGSRSEIFHAVSACGRWDYERMDYPGTPWIVRDLQAGENVSIWFGTLGSARKWTYRQERRETSEVPTDATPTAHTNVRIVVV